MKVKAAVREADDAIYLVINHKKKVLPTFFRECQVQFSGKAGLSLLGVRASHQGSTSF